MSHLSFKINSLIKNLPEKTGVYKYYNRKRVLIYIGKAKNLKKRVASYFRGGQNKKTNALVNNIDDIKYILVSSEIDALLLENNLIKNHKPKYNVLLKDSKTYPWICISNEKIPRVFQTREVEKAQGEYFGPYSSTYFVKILLSFFSDLFYNHGWTPFSYINRDIKSEEDLKNYLSIIDEIRKILKGRTSSLISDLKIKMMMCAKKLDFEEAQVIKQKIALIRKYQSKSIIVNPKISNVDVFSVVSKNETSYVNYLKIVCGSIVRSYTMCLKKKLEESEEELLTLAIIEIRKKFSSDSRKIYCSHKLTASFEIFSIICPKIGDKKKLVELSLANAKQEQMKAVNLTEKKYKVLNQTRLLQEVQKDLCLSVPPRHIECFDNSNTQGTNPMSACVVFKDGRPSKRDYRVFSIKSVLGPDDFASMEEVVYRRYLRIIKEGSKLPNLIIIDGGKGQLSATIKSLKKLEIFNKVSVISIAKRLEEIYFPNDKVPLFLDKRSETLKLIQRIRNEAHRFSIHHHRKKRGAMAFKSSLEDISGVGPKTIDLLIQKFGSVKKIKMVDKKTLELVVGKNKASKIIQQYQTDKP